MITVKIDEVFATPLTAEQLAQQLEDAKPKVVSMAQFRGALIIMGLKATVDNAVANSGDALLINDYEYRTEVKRDWHSFVAMATALGKTSAEIDALFELASTR